MRNLAMRKNGLIGPGGTRIGRVKAVRQLVALVALGTAFPAFAANETKAIGDAPANTVSSNPRAPRDFSGIIWSGFSHMKPPKVDVTIPPDIPVFTEEVFFPPSMGKVLKPWALDVWNRYKQATGVVNPEVTSNEVIYSHASCYPTFTGEYVHISTGLQFLIRDDIVVILHEANTFARIVYMNQEHPKNLKPSWLGHSVGRWEGDTLVIDTVGYNGLMQINMFIPTTTALRYVERYRLINNGTMLEGHHRYEDSGAFTAPIEFTRTYMPSKTQEIHRFESLCQEANDKPFPLSTKETEPLG